MALISPTRPAGRMQNFESRIGAIYSLPNILDTLYCVNVKLFVHPPPTPTPQKVYLGHKKSKTTSELGQIRKSELKNHKKLKLFNVISRTQTLYLDLKTSSS